MQKRLLNNHVATLYHRSPFLLLAGLLLCAVFLITFSVWGSVLASPVEAATSTTSAENQYPIKVFFSKTPESEEDMTAVFAVNRVSPTVGVGTFAIQMLIAGPTPEERAAGYSTELNRMLSGPSDCESRGLTGPDFTLVLNKKGDIPEEGTATLKFCRDIFSHGLGNDARVTSQINATLKQFSSIKKVAILTKDGHCFGDMSGEDICLR